MTKKNRIYWVSTNAEKGDCQHKHTLQGSAQSCMMTRRTMGEKNVLVAKKE